MMTTTTMAIDQIFFVILMMRIVVFPVLIMTREWKRKTLRVSACDCSNVNDDDDDDDDEEV